MNTWKQDIALLLWSILYSVALSRIFSFGWSLYLPLLIYMTLDMVRCIINWIQRKK